MTSYSENENRSLVDIAKKRPGSFCGFALQHKSFFDLGTAFFSENLLQDRGVSVVQDAKHEMSFDIWKT